MGHLVAQHLVKMENKVEMEKMLHQAENMQETLRLQTDLEHSMHLVRSHLKKNLSRVLSSLSCQTDPRPSSLAICRR